MQRKHTLGLAARLGLLLFLLIGAAGSPPQTLQVEHIDGPYRVIGGFTRLRTNHEDVHVPHHKGCHDFARSIREPFSAAYQPRENLDELSGEARLAFWGWEGSTSRQLFDAAAADSNFIRYKIVDRRIYAAGNYTPSEHVRRHAAEELMRIAVHLYPIPDMEFLAFYGDRPIGGRPVLGMNVLRDQVNPGFTLPTFYPWKSALGPTQMAAYHGCLWDRYPAHQRRPLIVWRGSTTGERHDSSPETCLKLLRVRVHMLSREHPDLFDAHIHNIVNDPCGELLRPLLTDRVEPMPPEDFNHYCAVMDMDGNAWSDRFLGELVHQPTLTIKQATNITSFGEHFFAPGTEVELFDRSLDGIVEQARRIIEDCKLGEASKGQAMARRAQAAAAELLGHIGMVRSMAYALVNYRRLCAFEPNTSTLGFERLSTTCCQGSSLPPELLDAMAARDLAPS